MKGIYYHRYMVDLNAAYYNSSPQVTALLVRVRDVILAAGDPERHQTGPRVSELVSRSGQPRAIRDRLAPEEYQRLLAAARAGALRNALAEEFEAAAAASTDS